MRTILSGHEPKVSRAAEICRALGLEFYIGPPRGGDGSKAAPAALPAPLAEVLGLDPGAGVEDAVKAIEDLLKGAGRVDAASLAGNLRDKMTAVVAANTEALRAEIMAMRAELTDVSALARSANDDASPDETRPLEVHDLAAAAGAGAVDIDSAPVVGRLWFNVAWLKKRGLDPARCAVIGVMGESMEPLLYEGSRILVDRARTDWNPGGILVVRAGDGLVVKRAGEDEDGNRLLLSEHPAWTPIPLPDDAEVIGRVVWMGRELA